MAGVNPWRRAALALALMIALVILAPYLIPPSFHVADNAKYASCLVELTC
jgi:hypothetical protein